jgi:hypothetical protein
LSGIKNESATGLNTPIWCRTRVRSGRVGGSTSQINSKRRSVMPRPYRQPVGEIFRPFQYPTVPLALSSDYKNLQVRRFLDAAEEAALSRAFARAHAEADMSEEFGGEAW